MKWIPRINRSFVSVTFMIILAGMGWLIFTLDAAADLRAAYVTGIFASIDKITNALFEDEDGNNGTAI